MIIVGQNITKQFPVHSKVFTGYSKLKSGKWYNIKCYLPKKIKQSNDCDTIPCAAGTRVTEHGLRLFGRSGFFNTLFI